MANTNNMNSLRTPISELDNMRLTALSNGQVDQNGHWRRDAEGFVRRDENGFPIGKAGIVPPPEKLLPRMRAAIRTPVNANDPQHPPAPIGGHPGPEQLNPGPIFPGAGHSRPGGIFPPAQDNGSGQAAPPLPPPGYDGDDGGDAAAGYPGDLPVDGDGQ